MFNHLLVPLDGSNLAEATLPVALSMAKILHAPVTLLHIIEQDAASVVHNDRHLTTSAEAQEYLEHVKQTFFPKSVQVDTHIHTAPVTDVAKSIIDHARQEFQPDLILLCSHGKGGMRDILVGSIAQQVAALGGTPVLLIKPGQETSPFELKRILVPLDNESNHDQALPFAEFLAKSFHAQLDLVCVIPTLVTDSGAHAAAGTMLPTTASAYLDIAEEIAEEHFQEHLDDFGEKGIQASATIRRGDPAGVIVKEAENQGVDIILFGTHGRAGLDAFWNRSVTATVAKKTQIPLLLIPLS